SIDGLPGSEAPFVACSFWLVEQYASSGRLDDARALMDRLCALVNDVGMVSEEYDVGSGRHAGNTPQALSRLALVRAADALVLGGHRSRSRAVPLRAAGVRGQGAGWTSLSVTHLWLVMGMSSEWTSTM